MLLLETSFYLVSRLETRDNAPPNSAAAPTTRRRAVRREGFEMPELIACTSEGAWMAGTGVCTNAPAEVVLLGVVIPPVTCLKGDTKASPPTADTAKITAKSGAKRMPFMLNTTVSVSGEYYATN